MQDHKKYPGYPYFQPPPRGEGWATGVISGARDFQGGRQPRGHAMAAWLVIILAIAIFMALRFVGERMEKEDKGPGRDELGIVLVEVQGKYVVGATSMSDPGMLYNGMKESLNQGSIDQRQRFVVLAAELKGREEAARLLRDLDDDIAEQAIIHGSLDKLMTPEQQQAHLILLKLYLPAPPEKLDEILSASATTDAGDGGANDPSTQPDQRSAIAASDAPFLDRLGAQERALLVRELGWFGRLALAPPTVDDQRQRDEVIFPARVIFFVLIGGFFLICVAGLLGFIALVVMLVFAILGSIKGNFSGSVVHHGIYAETFAAWFVLFVGLQIAGQFAGSIAPKLALMIGLAASFGSLLALAWPVMRGVPWNAVRHDIGWTLGRNPVLEPLLGPAGYVLGLPILAIGVLLTLGFMYIQQEFAGQSEPLKSSSGPAHPVIKELADAGWLVRIQLLMLGSIAAPIVEETMFRGVLYRHLRNASARWGVVASILLATLINSVVFAIIHPQSWVAWPALASLAVSFSLMREWRGTLIPSIIMHAIQNGLVFGLLIFILSVS